MSDIVQLHPDNRKIFEYKGKPRVLLCATEHYGAVINRPFRYERYLADARDRGQTLTRLFTLFRELQSAVNPYSTCKPESPDFVTPFVRTGPGVALDGQPVFDLEQWNPEYFDRLHGFLSLAEAYGIVVEVVLFSNTYNDVVWSLNPLNPNNNVTMDPEPAILWQDYMTTRWDELWRWQQAHARKILQETNRYRNVIYEICNEPCHFPGGEGLPQADEVNDWQRQLITLIRDTEKDLPNQHLVAGQEAMTIRPFDQPSELSFHEMDFDVVNIHPLPNTSCDGNRYELGEFMSKQLKLEAVRDFALAAYKKSKPLNYDEDNAATQYKEPEGWTVHRKRAWTTLFCGAHYDMIDFSITPYTETGTPASQKGIRLWFEHLSTFIHSIDLVKARPLKDWLKQCPDHVVVSVFGVEDQDYCVYLADAREVDEPGCGTTIESEIRFDLPKGSFGVSCYSPVSGVYSPVLEIEGGTDRTLELPEFNHDLVVRIRRKSDE
jgi:hypothetical protein